MYVREPRGLKGAGTKCPGACDGGLLILYEK